MLGVITQFPQAISQWAKAYYQAFEEVAEETDAFDSEAGRETRRILRRLFRV